MIRQKRILAWSLAACPERLEDGQEFVDLSTGKVYTNENLPNAGKTLPPTITKKPVADNTSPAVKVSEGDMLHDKETGKDYIKKSGKWVEAEAATEAPKKKTTTRKKKEVKE